MDTALVSDDEAVITAYRLNSIEVDTRSPKNGYLCFSEVFYPGWNASIDDKEAPVMRANWNLRAVPIIAGNHHVVMRFEPKSFTHGMWITLCTLSFAVIGIIVDRKIMVTKHYHKSMA